MLKKEQLRELHRRVLPIVKDPLVAWGEGVTEGDLTQAAQTHLSFAHFQERIAVIERYLHDFITTNKRILEIGTGFGGFIVY